MRLTVEALTFAYKKQNILENVSFETQGGVCMALLGENGAGKSTLLSCICRILRAKSGRVMLSGRDLSLVKPRELATLISYVPQTPSFAEQTVFEAVLGGRRPYLSGEPTREDLAMVSEAIEKLGMAPLAMRRTSELSGGERQKTALARALVQRAQVLLLDEPTASLDMRCSYRVTAMLKALAKREGIAVIASMHDINLAMTFADRFAMLKDGRVVAEGGHDIVTPERIYEVYGARVEMTEYKGRHLVVPMYEEKK